MTHPTPTLANRVAESSLLTQLALVLTGSLLLWASAKVHVPFWPVPMTLQTGVVLLLAMGLGRKLAIATIVLYLAQGAMGLPVFSGTPERGIGIAYMMGPTGGYMLGWLLAAAFLGWVAERTRHVLPLLGAAVVAIGLNYAPGLAWLSVFTGWQEVIALGAAPFILGDLVKAGLAVAIVLGLTRVVSRQA